MNDLDDLYRDIIVDHYQRPRCQGTLPAPTHQHHGLNPLCGDEVEFQLRVDAGKVAEVRFQGSGCSISLASASMLAEQLQGKSLDEVSALNKDFKTWIKDRAAGECPESLGDFAALSGVRSYPVRVKCALLPFATVEQALGADA
jgi:nitrogen fixation protein NifU and related proteins